jgi:putative FmdB family regulatory protein
MPTYDYVCEACEHKFELMQSIKADAIKKCPECGKNKLRRLIGPGAAIVFKGSGFYTTDYRSESYKKAAAADKQGDKHGDKQSDKPGDKPSDKQAAETSSGEKSTEKPSDKSADTGGKKAKTKEKGPAKK